MSDADGFRRDVLSGLAARPRSIPPRHFYDRRGSELFEAITALPEYYPTRTEVGLLEAHGAEIARRVGTGRVVVEFGSGSSAKTPLLLRHVRPAAYVPVDISAEFLAASAAALAASLPGLEVLPVAADFTGALELPERVAGSAMLGFFPGSTVGNFDHAAAVDLLRSFRRTLGDGARLVIGVDTRKDAGVLVPAYDDAAGVTAEFNRNLLHRMNRELGGDVPVAEFLHRAEWNAEQGRMEMHLVAARDLRFTVAGEAFAMARGESIHTENSYKYTHEEARLLARAGGWEPEAAWFDADGLFGLHLWAAG